MRNGHKGRMACGILELMLGVGLILYCLLYTSDAADE